MSRLRFAALAPIALLGSTIAHAAQYDCLVAFGIDTSSNCQPPIALEEFSAGDALVSIDMSNWRCLRVTAKIRDPLGWVMNIGNSYSNNGGAGDSGDFSNDSELEITFDEPLVPESQGQGLLRVFDNDYTAHAMPVLKIGDFIDRHRSGVRIEVGDQCVRLRTCAHSRHQGTEEEPEGSRGEVGPGERSMRANRNATLQSEYVFRLGGVDAEAGANDFVYWVGLNRVVHSGSPRTGSGVQKVFFTLSTDACAACD